MPVKRGVRVFPCRLLVDLPNWLGDFVHALPALEILLAANAQGDTTLLVPAAHVPLARKLGVAVLPRPEKAGLAFARTLPACDVALSFRHSTRAKLLLFGLRAKVKLASSGRGAALLGLTTFAVDRSLHQRHDLDGALCWLGLPGVDGQPPRSLRQARRMVRPLRVVLLPGSHRDCRKRYPKEGFAQLAQAFARRGLEVVAVVGPSDAPLGAWLAGAGGCRLLPPTAGLAEVAGFLATARLAIGNDTGLTHLAAAVGCPTIALFGPTSPGRTAPSPGLALCAPEFARRGWEGLPLATVLAAASRVLAGDLHPEANVAIMKIGGGPLAQLAEQGTLNP